MKSLRLKLLLSFGIIIVLTLAVSVINSFIIRSINNNTEGILSEQLPALIHDEQLAFNISQRIALARGYVLYEDESYIDKFKEYTNKSIEVQNKILNESSNPELKELVERSIKWRTDIENEIFAAIQAGNKDQAMATLKNKIEPEARYLMEHFANLADKRESQIQSNGTTIIKDGDNNRIIGLAIGFFALITGLIISYFSANLITKPIQSITARMKEMSKGIIRASAIETKSKD